MSVVGEEESGRVPVVSNKPAAAAPTDRPRGTLAACGRLRKVTEPWRKPDAIGFCRSL